MINTTIEEFSQTIPGLIPSMRRDEPALSARWPAHGLGQPCSDGVGPAGPDSRLVAIVPNGFTFRRDNDHLTALIPSPAPVREPIRLLTPGHRLDAYVQAAVDGEIATVTQAAPGTHAHTLFRPRCAGIGAGAGLLDQGAGAIVSESHPAGFPAEIGRLGVAARRAVRGVGRSRAASPIPVPAVTELSSRAVPLPQTIQTVAATLDGGCGSAVVEVAVLDVELQHSGGLLAIS